MITVFRVDVGMEKAALYLCTVISCFIVVNIIWEFMNERYNRAFKNKYIYFVIEFGMVIAIAAVNILENAFLNLFVWAVGIALSAYFLYYENADKPVKRILECEVLLLCIGICESLGVVCGDWLLRMLHIQIETVVLLNCFEIIFSKVIVIFLYYIAIGKLMRTRNTPFSKMQYFINVIVLLYTLVNIFVIAYNMNHRPGDYLLVVNLGCIVIGDLYLLYFVRVISERNYFEYEIKSLEKQAEIQYEYYVRQEQKYDKTVRILHDVNKHIKAVEQLYANQEVKRAEEYTEQIRDMLAPLLPIKYTGNPILDILLTDKAAIMSEKAIDFDIRVDNVNLEFIEAIDVTTIFGNLLDNAIEACEEVKQERSIYVIINNFHEMIVIRIGNSCMPVKWKNGMPVSKKGNNRGIGLRNVRRAIEKYDGDMKLEDQKGMFIVDIFLNS